MISMRGHSAKSAHTCTGLLLHLLDVRAPARDDNSPPPVRVPMVRPTAPAQAVHAKALSRCSLPVGRCSWAETSKSPRSRSSMCCCRAAEPTAPGADWEAHVHQDCAPCRAHLLLGIDDLSASTLNSYGSQCEFPALRALPRWRTQCRRTCALAGAPGAKVISPFSFLS